MTKALTTMAFKPNASTTFNVRMFEIDGEPWFVATDVCRALGLDVKSGSTMHLRKLDADERQPVPPNLVEGSGRGMAQATLVSEAGLYKLIAKSDKPAAKAFDRWVRHEVLPAIRKTGGYLLNEEARETAHADDRAGMPLPEAFAQVLQQVLQQQVETQRLLTELLAERKAGDGSARDERLLSAREAKEMFRLPGSTQEIGLRVWEFCDVNGVKYRKRRTNLGVNRYPAWTFTKACVPA